MSDRVQLDHLLLDVDFMHKPTVVAFRRRFGWVAVTWLIEVYCQMSRATEALITRDVLLAISEDMRMDTGEEMIAYALENGLIFQVEDRKTHFSNTRVIRDQQGLASRRKSDRERQERYRSKTVTQPLRVCDSTVFPDTDTDTDTDTESRLDLEKEQSPPPPDPKSPSPPGPDSLSLDTVSQKLLEFGVDFPGCALRAYDVARGQYGGNPNIFQLTKPWIIKELLAIQENQIKLDTAKVRNVNARAGPKSIDDPETRAAKSREINRKALEELRKTETRQ